MSDKENKLQVLDREGLIKYDALLKTEIAEHTENNDIHVTSDDKTKISLAYEHAGNAHAPVNAEPNEIVSIKKNGTTLPIDASRAVDIVVPTKLSEFENDANFLSNASMENLITEHNTNNDAHADIRALIDDLNEWLEVILDSDDETLNQMSEIVAYIKSNKSLIESVTTSKVNVSDIVDNLTTNVSSKVLSAAQGVAIKALIDALDAELDALTTTVGNKADKTHTHNYAGSATVGGDAYNALKFQNMGLYNASNESFTGIPYINSDGVMEIGKHLDFHVAAPSDVDHDARITARTDGLTLAGLTLGTFQGNLTGTASKATLADSASKVTHALSVNGKSYDGSAAVDVGTLGVAYGGTGCTTGNAAANYFLNELSVGSSDPTDTDYYISQFAGGGTTTTTYHRRPISYLWNYMNVKASAVYFPLTGGTVSGNIRTKLSSGETSFGAVFDSTNNYSLYLYGNTANGARGIYDGKLGKSIIQVNDSGASFIGNAETATWAARLKRVDGNSTAKLTYTNANFSTYGYGIVMYDANNKPCYLYFNASKDAEAPSIRVYGADGSTNAAILTEKNYSTWAATKNHTHAGSYTTATAASSLPVGLSMIELPATATVDGDPTYGQLLTVFNGVNRAFQIGNSGGELYFRGLHSVDYTGGYSSWRRIVYNSGTWGINITGTATYASLVAATSTNPTSGTTYGIPFINGSSSGSDYALRLNNGIKYYTVEGTATSTGHAQLGLGNTTPSGTVGNKTGAIYMYGNSSGYTQINPSNHTSTNVNVYLPTSGGTLALTTDNVASSNVAAQLGQAGNISQPMKFHWSGQSGQPGWLWGGNNYTDIYVYNPSNFDVKGATSLTASTTLNDTDATDAFFESVILTFASCVAGVTPLNNDGMIISIPYSSSYASQIWLDDGSNEARMAIRNRKGGTSWNPWREVLTEYNYTDYTVTKTGTGASGTWGISITGNATTTTLSAGTADASRYVFFQDSTMSTTNVMACYDADFLYNPNTNTLTVANIVSSGTIDGTAKYANYVKDIDNNAATTFAYSKTGMTSPSWFAAWNGYELRAVSPANTLKTIGAVAIKPNGYSYNSLTSYYTGSTVPTFYRITLPDSTVSVWTMLNIEISVRENYSNETGGKILINAHHANTAPAWQFTASTLGYLTTSIKVYGSDGKYLYIGGCQPWSTISIDKILVGDQATNYDLSNITIDIVTELPETHQTATMYYGLHSGGGTLNSGARIGHSGSMYLGNADNSGWVYTQDIASHNGTSQWAIRVGGEAWFKKVNIGGWTYGSSGSATLNTSSFYCMGDASIDGGLTVGTSGLLCNGNMSFAAGKKLYRNGLSSSWITGRDNAILVQNTISGYSPAISIKTTNGSWEVGAYNESGYVDNLVYSYCTDSNYSNGTNNTTGQIRFSADGTIYGKFSGSLTGSISGNAATCGGTALEWAGSIAWADTGWIAAWNSDGSKIKALNKNSFAAASHTHSYLPLACSNSTPLTGILYFKTNSWCGNIVASNASGQKRWEIYTADNTGAVANTVLRTYSNTEGTTYVNYTFGTNGTLTLNQINPTTIGCAFGNEVNFLASSADMWINYRTPSGGTAITKYYFGNSAGGYGTSSIYTGYTYSDYWISPAYGGGWFMSDSSWIRTYGSKNIYQNSGIMRTDGTLQVGADGTYFKASSSGVSIGVTTTSSAQIKSTFAGVGGFQVTHGTADVACGFQATRSDTSVSARIGISSSGNVGLWGTNSSGSMQPLVYKKPTDTSDTTYIGGRVVMAGTYGTSAPPTTGTLTKGMVYFQIIS